MPKRSSKEWFSIITTTMCSIFGNMSVPSGSVGFGPRPGLRNTFGIVDGVGADVVVPAPSVDVEFAVVDFDDDEHPASSATASPAPATAIPFNSDRRLTAEWLIGRVSLRWSTAPAARTAAHGACEVSRDRG